MSTISEPREVLALRDEARHRPRAAGRSAADVRDLQTCQTDLQRARLIDPGTLGEPSGRRSAGNKRGSPPPSREEHSPGTSDRGPARVPRTARCVVLGGAGPSTRARGSWRQGCSGRSRAWWPPPPGGPGSAPARLPEMRVTVWGENVHERTTSPVRAIYPDGMHGAIAAGLPPRSATRVRVRTATLEQPEHGLTEDVLDDTDVLTWWGHIAHDEVDDAVVDRVHAGGAGRHGPARRCTPRTTRRSSSALLGTPAACAGATRASASWSGPSTRRTRSPPASRNPIVIDAQEMYGEPFDIPAPDELVFISSFAGGEVFRGGCCFGARRGPDLLLQPGRPGVPGLPPPRRAAGARQRGRWAAPVAGRSPSAGRGGSVRGVVVGAGALGPFWARELVASPETELVGWVDLGRRAGTSRGATAAARRVPDRPDLGRMLAGSSPTSWSTSPRRGAPVVTLAALDRGRPGAEREADGDVDGGGAGRWSRPPRTPAGSDGQPEPPLHADAAGVPRAVAGLGTLSSLTCDFYPPTGRPSAFLLRSSSRCCSTWRSTCSTRRASSRAPTRCRSTASPTRPPWTGTPARRRQRRVPDDRRGAAARSTATGARVGLRDLVDGALARRRRARRATWDGAAPRA